MKYQLIEWNEVTPETRKQLLSTIPKGEVLDLFIRLEDGSVELYSVAAGNHFGLSWDEAPKVTHWAWAAKDFLDKKALTANTIARFAKDIHQNAKEHGWWDTERNTGESIALMHSELSEALEVLRKDPEAKDKHIPDFPAFGVELADCIIRILDTCAAAGIDIGECLVAKHEYNKTRPYKHGKNF